MTRGRVPTLRTLEVIRGEETETSFKEIIQSIRLAMEQGVSMSQALQKYPSEFSPSVVELIRMAEKSGAWDEILLEITGGLSEGTFD
ncbi:MAG: type II secretion system F family protein [Kiritimatiellae bacterium]|nr:type II secretion system F family protein [Kiritimatiellia bacterium]MDD5519359.1 type II secretion system F family protein [Kiritimatiellia bacterium]